MPIDRQCAACGGANLEPGMIQSAGKIYFRPTNAKFLMLKSANIQVNANVCTDCGHINLIADIDALDSLTERAKPF